MPAEAGGSRRAQPVRQTRTNPARAFGAGGRSLGARGSVARAADDDDEDQHEIYPAITHFADAVIALPRELVRHFTLLKEVDAKIFAPEETLGQMVDTALKLPVPESRHNQDTNEAGTSASINGSTNGSINGSMVNDHGSAIVDSIEGHDRNAAIFSQENIPRRQLFRQLAFTMQEMLVSLDEKNHVISTATEALDKHTARLTNVMPYVEAEISEEARWGSTKHWAYADNRIPNKLNERSKREKENVNALSRAAAEAAAEEAQAKADRKQPARDKKNRNQHHAESDFDDHGGKGDKRAHGNAKKSRQSDVAGTNGGANGPPLKRRKVDKEAKGGSAMERAASGIHGVNGASKGKNSVNSPRETPIPEPKKRAKPANANGQPRKRYVIPPGLASMEANSYLHRTQASNIANTTSIASSPIHGSFAEAKAASRISPPPTNGRPTASRARQNSMQSIQDQAKQRPSSSASNKPNGSASSAELLATITGRSASEAKTSKDSGTNGKDHTMEGADEEETILRGGASAGDRTKGSSLKHEDTETGREPGHPTSETPIPLPTTTKSGRASKNQTPIIGGPETSRTTSRRSTVGAGDNSGKRSHKKGQGQAAAAQLVAAAAHEDEPAPSEVAEEEELVADDEPRYCYCNGVSYGEMVACDAEACKMEWFHLECVGLRVAPKGNGKSNMSYMRWDMTLTVMQLNGIVTTV